MLCVERAKANLVERFNLQLSRLHNFSLIDCIGALYNLLSLETNRLVSCSSSPGANVPPQFLLGIPNPYNFVSPALTKVFSSAPTRRFYEKYKTPEVSNLKVPYH